MVKIEAKAYLNVTDEGVTTTFYEGDNVICCVSDEERHIGKIIGVGTWKEYNGSDSCNAIWIDTSKSARSYSGEIIKVDDITYICKNPLINEELPNNIE